ncbi:MAG: ADP-ribosylglycohydrolase family protein [Patescibacteria group bacterium]|jgi:ADP-ribosylglycohydrolase
MRIKQRVINSATGLHLGDTLGMPVECLSRELILSGTGGTGITGPMPGLVLPRKLPDTRDLLPGSTTDDSQLFNATADALIQAGTYDHELQVLHHLYALWNDVAGWGGTTKFSLFEHDKWYRARARGIIKPPNFKGNLKNAELWAKAIPRNPAHPAPHRAWKSRGNGVGMKVPALALFLGLRNSFDNGVALETIMQYGRMTHADPVCSIAAYAVAWIVAGGLSYSPEGIFLQLIERVEQAEHLYRLQHVDEVRFSDALKHALRLSGDPEALWAFGSGDIADALTTIPLAIAIWYRHCEDPEPTAAVLEAINAGGDTDTVAAMVGAMMGAGSCDPNWWPKDWVSHLHDSGQTAKKIGNDLYSIATRRTAPEGWDPDVMLRKIGYK